MVNLLNGNTLTEALEKFRKYKCATHKKMDSYCYYKVEEYVELLDQCFGVDGYLTHYNEANVNCLPTGQCILLVKATVDIFDVDGKVVYRMEGYGTYEVALSKDTGNFINLSTAGTNANVNALKAACINNGAFGSRSESADDRKGRGKTEGFQKSNAAQQRISNYSASKDTLLAMKFFVKREMAVVRKDMEGRPTYRMIGYEVEGGRMRSDASEILFYPNQYRKDVAKLNEMVAWASSETVSKGKVITLQVAVVADEKRNKNFHASYTFKSFAS